MKIFLGRVQQSGCAAEREPLLQRASTPSLWRVAATERPQRLPVTWAAAGRSVSGSQPMLPERSSRNTKSY